MKNILVITLILCSLIIPSHSQQATNERLTYTRIETDFNLIFVPIQIAGKTFSMILDTGAGFSILDETVAKSLGLELKNQRTIQRPGGQVRLSRIQNLSFKINDFETTMNIASANLTEGGFNDYIGRNCAGILGYDFIRNYAFEIDYFNKLLAMYKANSYTYQGNGKAINMKLKKGMPVIPASILLGNQLLKGDWLIDTGSLMSLGLNESYYDKYQLKDKVNNIPSIAVGFGGSTPGQMYKLRGLSLLGFQLKNIIAGHAKDGINEAEFDGVIGGEVFSRFTLVINYATQKAYLEPNDRFGLPVRWDLSGLQMAVRGEDGFEVLHVYKDSPAHKAGIAKGDIITHIDQIPVKKLGLPLVWQMLRSSEGRLINITYEHKGATKKASIQLTDYFKLK